MAHRKPLCQIYDEGESAWRNSLDAGRYRAAVECRSLPRRMNRDNHVIRRGYAVGFGQWMFFTALEPALTFGRAARMSFDCTGYGVYEAAHEMLYCHQHGDERVLLLDLTSSLDRRDGEAEALLRFAQGVKGRPDSAHWHPPTPSLHRRR